MSTTSSPSQDELEILQLVDQWKHALCARDLDALMQHYASDVVFFDAVPPHEHRGADAYRRTWEAMFDFLPPRLDSETRDMSIRTSGDLAVMHCLQRLVNADTGEAATCGWVRVTVCYERQQGAWRVVHEHVSVPFDPATSQAAFMHSS
jgi:uncharacterized protein (TIGR02246 family)